MRLNDFLKLVDEFGVVIIPFEKAPDELKALSDKLGSRKDGSPDEGEVIAYRKSLSPKDITFENIEYSLRVRELVEYLSVSDHQSHMFGDYIIEISCTKY